MSTERFEKCMSGAIGGRSCSRPATHDAYLRGGPEFADRHGIPVCPWHAGSVNRNGFTAIKRASTSTEEETPA